MPIVGAVINPDDSRPPRFANAAIATFATQLAVAALSFISVLVVARALGPAGRGDIALLTTIALLTSGLALLGVDEANVNLAGREPAARRALATNSLLFTVLLGGSASLLLVVLMAFAPGIFGETDPALRWLAVATVPPLILKVYLKFLIGADYGFGVTNLAWLLPPALGVVVNLALAAAGELSVATAFVTWAIAHALATLLLCWHVARRGAGFGQPSLKIARRTLGFGLRSHPGRVLMAGNYRADQWFVGTLAGSRELGLYSIAVAWSEILFYLPTALTIVQRPYLVRAAQDAAARRTARVFRSGVAITAVSTLAMFALAPVLVVGPFGKAFSGAIDDLRVLTLGASGILMMKLFSNALTAQRLPGRSSVAAAAAFAATLTLDVLLIPSSGGLGAAIASSLAYSAGGVAACVLFCRSFGVRARELLPRRREFLLLYGELWRLFARSLPWRAATRTRL